MIRLEAQKIAANEMSTTDWRRPPVATEPRVIAMGSAGVGRLANRINAETLIGFAAQTHNYSADELRAMAIIVHEGEWDEHSGSLCTEPQVVEGRIHYPVIGINRTEALFGLRSVEFFLKHEVRHVFQEDVLPVERKTASWIAKGLGATAVLGFMAALFPLSKPIIEGFHPLAALAGATLSAFATISVNMVMWALSKDERDANKFAWRHRRTKLIARN